MEFLQMRQNLGSQTFVLPKMFFGDTLNMMLCSLVPLLTASLMIALAPAISTHDSLSPRLEPRATAVPIPIVVDASQDWDGNDGPWSSFAIQIGTPSQSLKVFPGTAAYQILAVVPEGCSPKDPTNCAQLRGGTFNYSQSTTWQPNTANLSTDIYPLALETRLYGEGRGLYGFDEVELGFPMSGGAKLDNQTIGGIAAKDFFVGLFGLNPRSSNFTSYNNPIPSFMQNLRSRNQIPSTSWGYTAGNQYRLNRVLGSLTLGGYDTSRFMPNNLTWTLNEIDFTDLTVTIEQISTNASSPLFLSTPIATFIDSSVSQIWLPNSSCALFENAFGLTWNETLELYLINDTQHTKLKSLSPSVTFTLGNTTSTQTVNITLPYAAFDLTLTHPLVDNATRYFPLKRAANESQYTLGRTFFQEAYVIADYDRRNFSVHQCNWEPNGQRNIVAILPPDSNSVLPGNPTTSANPSKLSSGAIAGIVIGVVVVVLLTISLVFIFVIKPRRRRAYAIATASALAAIEKPGLESGEGKPPNEMDGKGCTAELLDERKVANELEASGRAVELQGDKKGMAHETAGVERFEVSGSQVEVYEMPAREEVAVELEEEGQVKENGRKPNLRL